jgi:midasin
VEVFEELRRRRESSKIFESKSSFATLRDVFRWANRRAANVQALADDGYMLLAERTRRVDDKMVVKEVIESIFKVQVSLELYDINGMPDSDRRTWLGCDLIHGPHIVWTGATFRLFVLISRALLFNEPVLLVGEPGCGKTAICEIYARSVHKCLRTVNCHQNTETADFIGGPRPIRNRSQRLWELYETVHRLVPEIATEGSVENINGQDILTEIEKVLQDTPAGVDKDTLLLASSHLRDMNGLFEWQDGPLVQAMKAGDIFLLDELSIADDSVLERLNSVLEPQRRLTLAERLSTQPEIVSPVDGFQILATMNPGGDFGKKELSPALRNRFTEIWVPNISVREDVEPFLTNIWSHQTLHSYTSSILDFRDWVSETTQISSLLTLRDLLVSMFPVMASSELMALDTGLGHIC